MKRYVCTVAAGFVLALMSTTTASANVGLPDPGQSGTQVATLGDQTVGEQKNDADVTQEQGNGNVNLSPAIAIGGDATATNEQGNDNYASSDVDQENDVDQSQESTQNQSLDQSGSSGDCCTDQSQSGEQKTYGGDQSVEEQRNDADVTQAQGNGNVNVSPAIAVFGDAETTNEQGNDNVAKSDIDQENDVDQSQSSTQKQELSQNGGTCCESTTGYGKDEYGKKECCEPGQSQTGEQKTSFGDQWVGEQRNDADVTQKQGSWNGSFAPAIAIGGKRDACDSKCGSSWHPSGGNATTTNAQGNGNYAKSDIDQENEVDQSQSSTQKQSLTQAGGDCCKPRYDCSHGCQPKKEYGREPSKCSSRCEPKKDYGRENCCESGQTGEQKTSFGDQWVGEQRNDADVTQKQGSWNGSFAPAIADGSGRLGPCNSKCASSWHPVGGNATTANKQGNDNWAKSDIDQKNDVDQSQTSHQQQTLVDTSKGLIYR